MNKKKSKDFALKLLPKATVVIAILGVGLNASAADAANFNTFNRKETISSAALEMVVTDVSGKVIDDKTGETIPGVSVTVKGRAVATATDINGMYALKDLQPADVLVFSSVGYETIERNVGTNTTINVSMVFSQNKLNEVVVVGYGTQKRANVTGSIATANLEDFRNSPNVNIGQLLQGTTPGLNVGAVSGAGDTPNISIRGRNTISGNGSVLIVVDGIQYRNSLSSINPDDIATIDILKDASSTAVYGAQAANGVLLITTKKGQKNAAPKIAFSTDYATQTPSGNLRPMNRDEYLNHVKELYYTKAFLAPDYTTPDPTFKLGDYVDISQRDGKGGVVDTDFDWYKAGTQTGHVNTNQLNVRGGGENITYLISGSLTNQEGYIRNDLFKRKSLRANVETNPKKWLTIGLQASGSFNNNDGAQPSLSDLLLAAPLATPYNADGSLASSTFGVTGYNPFLSSEVADYDRSNFLLANLYSKIDFPFLKGLSYKINFGNNTNFSKHYYASKYANSLNGLAYKNDGQYYDYTLDNILTYDKKFGKQSLTATLLYGSSSRKYNNTYSKAQGFTDLRFGYNRLDLGLNQFTTSDAGSEALDYQMARLNYAFDNKYLLTATVRRDGFSGFARNEKTAIFPSVSAGWILSDENFMKSQEWLNYAKVRLGYGTSGNQTARYNSLDKVSSQPAYVFGDGGTTVNGQYISSLESPNLRWEKTTELNTGLDFSILKNRLTGSVDYYRRKTNDLLFNVNIPTLTGYSNFNTNVGEIDNNGIELSLTSKNIDGENFKWSSTLNYSRNKNKVVELLGTGDLISSNLFIGQSLGAVYGYKTNGIYQIGEVTPPGYYTGSYRVVDQTGDGTITPADRSILGTTDPAYRVSLLNTFNYKKITLTVFINSIQGGKNSYLGDNSRTLILDDNAVRFNYFSTINYWSPSNPTGEYPSYLKTSEVVPAVNRDRSFIRLQDVSLSYKIDNELTKKWGVSNLSVFASGKNLYTLTKWKGWDPELSNGGLTVNGRPLLKGYSLGLNITF